MWDNTIPSELIVNLPFNGGVVSPKKKRTEPFILGPLPVWWFKTATKECGPNAAMIGLILFFHKGFKYPPKPIKRTEYESWGMSRNTRDAAIKKLLGSSLITVIEESKKVIPVLDLTTRKPSHVSDK